MDFNTIGADRQDAPVHERRAQSTLQKLESTRDGAGRTIPQIGQYFDRTFWSNLDTDWRQAKAVWGPKVH